jgi:hypothetical protein
MDILKMIYDTLIEDEEIASQAAGKIKFYEFPDSLTMDDGPHIIIEPLDIPRPIIFGDNHRLINDSLFQIETWSKNRTMTREIAEKIESLLWEAGFSQVGGLNEYDDGIYRDARRFRKANYSDDFISKELALKDFLTALSIEQSITLITMKKSSRISGEMISESFTNIDMKRDRIASLFSDSRSIIDGTLERASMIDFIISLSNQTSSQAKIELRKTLSADVLGQTSVSSILDMQSFTELTGNIQATTFSSSIMDMRSFIDFVINLQAESFSSLNLEILSFIDFAAETKMNTSTTAAADVESVFPGKPNIEVTELYNAARIDWQPTTNTDSYKVYRATNPANLGTMLIEIIDGTTTYTDITANGGTIYYYTVKALNVRSSTNSDKLAATPSTVQTYENHLVDFVGYTAWKVYGDLEATNDFGNINQAVQGGDRLKVDTSERLRFYLPTGMVGSANAGGIIKAGIVPKNEYTIEYEIRFDSGFPWSKGGKVPGFSGGAGYTGGSGDGARTGDGFSVRMMWREDGRIIPYLYYYEMPDDFGHTFGETLGYFTDTKAHKVKYYGKLNTGSDKNGILRIYIDDAQVFEKTNLIYRTDTSKIDTVHLSIFPGGSDETWNMTGDGYIRLSYVSWQ